MKASSFNISLGIRSVCGVANTSKSTLLGISDAVSESISMMS